MKKLLFVPVLVFISHLSVSYASNKDDVENLNGPTDPELCARELTGPSQPDLVLSLNFKIHKTVSRLNEIHRKSIAAMLRREYATAYVDREEQTALTDSIIKTNDPESVSKILFELGMNEDIRFWEANMALSLLPRVPGNHAQRLDTILTRAEAALVQFIQESLLARTEPAFEIDKTTAIGSLVGDAASEAEIRFGNLISVAVAIDPTSSKKENTLVSFFERLAIDHLVGQDIGPMQRLVIEEILKLSTSSRFDSALNLLVSIELPTATTIDLISKVIKESKSGEISDEVLKKIFEKFREILKNTIAEIRSNPTEDHAVLRFGTSALLKRLALYREGRRLHSFLLAPLKERNLKGVFDEEDWFFVLVYVEAIVDVYGSLQRSHEGTMVVYESIRVLSRQLETGPASDGEYIPPFGGYRVLRDLLMYAKMLDAPADKFIKEIAANSHFGKRLQQLATELLERHPSDE